MLTEPHFTRLKRIPNPKGDVFHALKSSDTGFAGFGEAYFSHVICGELKGWKRHRRMQMNLIVPVGEVEFFFVNNEHGVDRFVIGYEQYGRLTVPPGIWFAFRGLSKGVNLVLNVASIEHDPAESETRPVDYFELPPS